MGRIKQFFGLEPRPLADRCLDFPVTELGTGSGIMVKADPDVTQYYGGGNTIHQTAYLDIETHNGSVVAVWFRCCPLPFKQTEVKLARALEMLRVGDGKGVKIEGITLRWRK